MKKNRARSEKTLSRFSKRVDFMLSKLETKIGSTEKAIGTTMKSFKEGDNISYGEVIKVMKETMRGMKFGEDEISRVIQDLDLKGDGKISKDEVAEVVKFLQEEMGENVQPESSSSTTTSARPDDHKAR